jgi:predicted PurR-regulated permease PerM
VIPKRQKRWISPLQVLGGTFGTLIEGLGSIGIVILLVVFFLVRREDLRDRFIRLVGKGQVTVTTNMLGDAAKRVSRYLSMLFIVNLTFGIAVGIGLYLIGIPNASGGARTSPPADYAALAARETTAAG